MVVETVAGADGVARTTLAPGSYVAEVSDPALGRLEHAFVVEPGPALRASLRLE